MFNQAAPKPIAPAKEGRWKKLMKQYGYAGVGVYVALSIIDLPFCYLLVASVGDEKIKEYQDKVKQFFGFGKDKNPEDATDKSSKYGTFLTTFFIAYGVHKSLVFIRLPITASITPGVVKQLQKWGFKVGTTSARKVIQAANTNIKNQGIRKSILTKEGIKDNIRHANNDNVYSNVDPRFGTKPKGKKWFNFFF